MITMETTTHEKALQILCDSSEKPFINLYGYSVFNMENNEKNRYDKAKTPYGGSKWIYLTSEDAERLRREQDHWTGLPTKKGLIILDIDDGKKGRIIYEGLKKAGIKHIAIKTPYGYQFVFADTGRVKNQVAKFITLAGVVCDYRLAGKGYIVMPSENTLGREFIHADDTLDPMPLMFLPVRKFNPGKDEGSLLDIPIFEGSRDDALFRHACRIREWNKTHRLGLSDDELLKVLHENNDIFCEPPLRDQEVWTKLKSACRYKTTSSDEEKEDWPEPLPFDDFSQLPDFPIETLPEKGKNMVKAVAACNQVDDGLPASIYLSVLSSCLPKKAKVNLKTHVEPLNIYNVNILESGERKSSTLNIMTKPLYDYQQKLQQDQLSSVMEAQSNYKIKENRLQKIQKQAAHCDNHLERFELEKEAAALAKDMAENPIPALPTLIADDVTTEKAAVLMAENNETLSIFSTEGGIFELMAGRYTEGINIELYLKAHPGDPFFSHRIGRSSVALKMPCLTMCLMVQPDVINEIGKCKQFRGRGLLARILYTKSKPHAGYRSRRNSSLSGETINKYQSNISNLLDIKASSQELELSAGAQDLWDNFYLETEADMRPGGCLEYVRDWGSKLPGQVARISGLLHIAEHGTEALSKHIPEATVAGACAIGEYFKAHALAAFGLMREDERIESAKRILEYVISHNKDRFKGRDVLINKNYFKTMEEVSVGLKVLVERGFIRGEEKEQSGQRGRPESLIYNVNPKVKTLRNHHQ